MGSHCSECVAAAQPAASERLRMWNAGAGALVTKAIIAVNIAVFLVVAVDGRGLDGGMLERRLVLFGPDVFAGDWYRLVTSGFVHYGLLHIGLNMYTLYRFGEMMEPALGRIRLVALYFASLLAGSFGALLVTPLAFTAGASGAVFGLLGAAAIGLRQRGVDVWRSGLGPMLAINLAITFLVPGISVGGHVGGLLGGIAVGSVMLRSAPTRRSTLEGVATAAAVAVVCVAGAVWAAGT